MRDFSSVESSKNAGILCVLRCLQNTLLGEKIRPNRKRVVFRGAQQFNGFLQKSTHHNAAWLSDVCSWPTYTRTAGKSRTVSLPPQWVTTATAWRISSERTWEYPFAHISETFVCRKRQDRYWIQIYRFMSLPAPLDMKTGLYSISTFRRNTIWHPASTGNHCDPSGIWTLRLLVQVPQPL